MSRPAKGQTAREQAERDAAAAYLLRVAGCVHYGESSHNFCTQCGARLRWKSSCGVFNALTDKYCHHCGERKRF